MFKEKTSVRQQIEILKSRNVRFDIVSEDDAIEFLCEKSYYFKIAAYRENFEYNKLSDEKILYKDLDFAYLKELSKLDTYLRYIILELSLDIEHMLKRWLIFEITKDKIEDGYSILNKFLESFPEINDSLKKHSKSPYLSDLYNKYSKEMLPPWVFCEMATFGTFLNFYNFYCTNKKIKPIINNKILNEVKTLRNASAHNNCLINNVYKNINSKKTIILEIKEWSFDLFSNKKYCNFSDKYIVSMLKKQFIFDFICILYSFCEMSSCKVVNKKIQMLYKLFFERFRKHKDFFKNNIRLLNTYNFIFSYIELLKYKYFVK